LDAAGFEAAVIVASNDLDEHRIAALRAAGAPISVWGVGTRLATGHPKPALGGVYKLSAIEDAHGVLHSRIKLSETPVKVSNPGVQQVRRRVDPSSGRFLEDVVYDIHQPGTVGRTPDPGDHDLLVPVMRGGELVEPLPGLDAARARTQAQLARLPDACLDLTEPKVYPLHLEAGLAARKEALIAHHRASGGMA
jgi:nicotinate phosphoribosyltransferase